MKKIFILFFILTLITCAFSLEVTVGEGSATTKYLPSYGYYNNSWGHWILPMSDASAMNFSEIQFNVVNTPSNYTRSALVYYKLTSETEVTNAYAEPVAAGFTLVYDGDITWNGSGWQGITLDDAIEYDGTQNIEFWWEDRTGSYSDGYPQIYATYSTDAGAYKYLDANFPEVDGTSVGYYPNTKLIAEIAGAPTIATLVSPENNSDHQAIDVSFTWTNGENTTSNTLVYSQNADLSDAITVDDATSPFAVNGLDNFATYYWKVISHSAIDMDVQTAVYSFVTIPVEGNYHIGSGDVTNNSIPMDPYYKRSYTQSIFYASDFTGIDGQIESIAWNYNGNTASTQPIKVYMATTTKTEFESNTDWVPADQLTMVYDGSVDLPNIESWVNVSFDVPFAYDGTDNLVIAVLRNNTEFFSGNDEFYGTATENDRSIKYCVDGNNDIDINALPTSGVYTKQAYPNTYFVTGDIATDPEVNVNITERNFGSMMQNTDVDPIDVNVMNIGSGSAEVTGITFTGTDAADFSYVVTGDQANIVAGTPLVVSVDLDTATSGNKSATLELVTSTGNFNVPFVANVIDSSGDTHTDPIMIDVSGDQYTNVGTTASFASDYAFTTANDVVYKLTLDQETTFDISLEGSSFDTKLWVINSLAGMEEGLTNADIEKWYYNDDETGATTGGASTTSREKTRATWSKMLPTLAPAGDYYIVISGYQTYNGEYTITMNFESAPTYDPATNFTATVAEDDVTLAWEAPANAENLTGYKVSRDGTEITTTTELTYVDSDLVNGTYEYSLVAQYGENNSVAVTASATVNVTVEETLPPTNLVATLNDNDVTLTWEAPATRNLMLTKNALRNRALTNYKIFKDNTLLATVASDVLTYDDNDIAYGTYEYYVKAVYTASDSDASNTVSITYSEPSNPLPPSNFTVDPTGDDAVLTWTAPGTGDDHTFTKCFVDEVGNGIGTNGVAEMICVNQFSELELANYQGMYITSISFVPWALTATFKVCAYSDNGTNLIMEQDVANPTNQEWNEVQLNESFMIPETGDLMIGFVCNATSGYPAGVDAGPIVEGGNVCQMNNGGWTTLNALASSLVCNWAVQANASFTRQINTDAPENVVNLSKTVVPNTTSADLAMISSSKVARMPETRNERDITGYRIYRLDNDDVASPDEWTLLTDPDIDPATMTYTDEDWSELDPGAYRFAIKTIYNDAVSAAAISEMVEKDMHGQVDVTIMDFTDTPLQGVNVSINDETIATDDNGVAHFGYIHAGEQEVLVKDDNYFYNGADIDVEALNTTNVTIKTETYSASSDKARFVVGEVFSAST